MKKPAFIISFTITGIAILFFLCEMGVRIFIPEITLQGMTKSILADSFYFTSHGLQPLSSGVTNGASVKIDRFGFRETSIPVVHISKTGWLFIGDSVTFGIGVDSDSTFAAMMQNELDAINILNPSASGYNINNYQDVFRYFVTDRTHNFEIERVIVFWCLNDVYTHMPDFRVPGGRIRHLFSDLLTFLRSHSRFYFFMKTWVFDRPKSYYLFDSQFYDSQNPSFLKAIESLRKINRDCRARKIDFMVVLLPYEYQLRTGAFSPQKQMVAALERAEIKVINPFPENWNHDSKEFFLYGDGIHLSNTGHRYIAERLLHTYFNTEG